MLRLTEYCNGIPLYNDLKIGSSVTSYFIPIINCNTSGNYHEKISRSNFIIYKKPAIDTTRSPLRFNLKNFLEAINTNMRLRPLDIGQKEKVLIHVAQGYIVNEKDEILMILTTKPNKLKLNYQSYFLESSVSKENGKHLTLLVSTELIANPIYSNFYKKLEKEYILDAYKAEIPVVFTTTSKIEKLTYSNEFELKFNTVDELQNHLKDNVGTIIFKNDSDFRTFNPGINSKIEDRQEKFIPIKVNEVLQEEEIPKMEGIVEQMRRRGRPYVDVIQYAEEIRNTVSYISDNNSVSYISENNSNNLLDTPNFLEYPVSPSEAFNSSILNELVTTPIVRRPSINLIDDTEEHPF